jgi:hypothetical protein
MKVCWEKHLWVKFFIFPLFVPHFQGSFFRNFMKNDDHVTPNIWNFIVFRLTQPRQYFFLSICFIINHLPIVKTNFRIKYTRF